MCLARWWNCGFLAIATAPSLSLKISVGRTCLYPSSPNSDRSQQASCVASDKATYSASVDDKAIVNCFFDHQVMAPLAAMKMYPVVDFHSSRLPYATSVYPWNVSDLSDSAMYVIPWDLVSAKYLSMHFSVHVC